MTFNFSPIPPRRWEGRYPRDHGNFQSLFHLRKVGSPTRRWWPVVDWRIGNEELKCWATPYGDVDDLVGALNAGKRLLGSDRSGGSFLINEWGQVLVSGHGADYDIAYVGNCEIALAFKDPRDSSTIDLSDDRGLECGNPWPRPYVGGVYKLSQDGRIYHWEQRGRYRRRHEPIRQDPDLIARLRHVRPSGGCRFVVNPDGIALTMRPVSATSDAPQRAVRTPAQELADRLGITLPPSLAPSRNGDAAWEPTYVGRVDLTRWFEREEC